MFNNKFEEQFTSAQHNTLNINTMPTNNKFDKYFITNNARPKYYSLATLSINATIYDIVSSTQG